MLVIIRKGGEFKFWMFDVSISLYSNNFEKNMNPSVLLIAIGKLVRETWLFSHGMATSPGEGKL